MNPSRYILLPVFGLLFFFGTVPAALAQLELGVPDHFNHLKPGTPLGSTNPIAASQYSSVGVSSGSAGPIATSDKFPSGTTEDPQGTPQVTVQLRSARAGNAFASGVARYYLGDQILPPLLQADNVTPAAPGYWRSRPVRPGENFTPADLSNLQAGATQPLVPRFSIVVTASSTDDAQVTVDSPPPSLTAGAKLLGQRVDLINGNTVTLAGTADQNIITPTSIDFDPYQPFYYSPHADLVFASHAGGVQIVWVTSAVEGGNWKFRRETFNVSGASSGEVRKIFWTEKSYNGPRVEIPAGQIDRVNPIYSANFPAIAPREYVPVGYVENSDPSSQPAEEKRTLWFEKFNGNGQLAAYNAEGRILVEYLGEEISPGRRQFLGADVIEVARQARFADHPVETKLGKRVLPRNVENRDAPTADTDLFASPVFNLSTAAEVDFYGTQALTDGTLDYWAERENLQANQVSFYWLEEADADIHLLSGGQTPGLQIQWPLFLDRYLFIWPPTLDEYAHVITDAGGSTVATGVEFEAGRQPEVIFQDDGSQTQAGFDSDTQRLIVDFGDSDDVTNRALLKFNNGAELWYQPVYTQVQGSRLELETSFATPAATTIITVPSTTGMTAGMAVTGSGITGSASIVSIIDDTHYVLSQHIAAGTNDFAYLIPDGTFNFATSMSIVANSSNPFFFSGGKWQVNRSTTLAWGRIESPLLTVTADGAVGLRMGHSYDFKFQLGEGRLFVSRNGGGDTEVSVPGQDRFQKKWSGMQSNVVSDAVLFADGIVGETYRFRLQVFLDKDDNPPPSPNWSISGISVGALSVRSSTSPPAVVTVGSTTGLAAGMAVSGPGIDGVATVVRVLNSTQLELSQDILVGSSLLTFADVDATEPLSSDVLVGTRIERPSADYSLAGAVVSGRGYQASAYINPYVSGVPAAEAGAIIPVNAPPSITNRLPDNQLIVRWFERIDPPAGSTGFSPFYVPSKVGRYNLSYPGLLNEWAARAPLSEPRTPSVSTVLQDGRVLAAGGFGTGGALASAEIYDPATDTWTSIAPMNADFGSARAVLLQDGRVLVFDHEKTELFDPATKTWTTAPAMTVPGYSGTADLPEVTLLNNGKVLVSGGFSPAQGHCELFDPATDTWSAAAPMNELFYAHSATLLADGRVLVTGGFDSNYINLPTGEIYDPGTKTWTTTSAAPVNLGFGSAALLLADGKVLVASADPPQLYDPVSDAWSAAGTFTLPLSSNRPASAPTRLPDGRVLVFTRLASADDRRTTQVYDPAANTWSVGPRLILGQLYPAVVTLNTGEILVVGGDLGEVEGLVPPSTPNIVMASNEGTDNLTPAQAAGFIYQQNNPANIGFNPNEEHAVKRDGSFWALRDDLNVTSGADYSSEPFVLVAYTDPQDARPAIRLYRVRRESQTERFNYSWTAGLKIQGPMPLPLMQIPERNDVIANTEVPGTPDDAPAVSAPGTYDGFTLEDRQGYKWIYRGPHGGKREDGGTGSFGMQWYYPMAADFDFPGMTTPPAVGTALPYLRPLTDGVPQGDAVSGTALTVIYRPDWPESVPSMRVAETLTLPKFGLPDVRNQKSAEVPYQQSIAIDGTDRTSVTLHDPTRLKVVTLSEAGLTTGLPSSIQTSVYQGKTYFQGLPPHLQTRFYFDPLASATGSLVFKGEFFDEIAGEDYLDLNVLSQEDEDALIALAVNEAVPVKGQWSNAIQKLKTRLETFIEDPSRKGTYIVSSNSALTRDVLPQELAVMPDSDTARDSYALTATGQGEGYVTLFFSDGEVPSLTPAGDPPAVKIIKVIPELYRGDLKVRLSSNPLDEKVTLRHSGDFAAKPEDYEFDWRSSEPTDRGTQPPTYTYDDEIYLGDLSSAATRAWRIVQNPGAALPSTGDYPAEELGFESVVVVKDGDYLEGSGLPGVVLKSASGVDFTSGIPGKIVFSANLGSLDGCVLYVNGAVALVHGNDVAALDAFVSGNAYDLRIARADSTDDLPVEGENLVIVAEISGALHFRIFDPVGAMVIDAGEAQFTGKGAEIADLTARLSTLWATTNLESRDKVAVVSAAADITGVDLDQDAASGLSENGLQKQFKVDGSFFIQGPNRIEVALYTEADARVETLLNLRLEGSSKLDQVTAPGSPWAQATGTPVLQNRAVIGGSPTAPLGSPLLVMSDNFFTMRYRPKLDSGNILAEGYATQNDVPWSDWARPALVEGWIKRVLAAINPFNQRMTDLYNNAVNTDVSLLSQAGAKWEGDIALTLDNINDAGLISIYETVLNRGKGISIGSGYDYGPANNALLLAAGYLNDLYTILGDEAYADAANPTISLDDQDTITEVNTSRFSFEGQVASSLDEELALLRGRDDFLSPQVTQAPFYNRLFWNYTRGINSGEALYAVNYNIKEKVGSSSADGSINAADAQRMFPQGHGDAYGHYLSAVKGYYKLLTNPSFTWKPQIESLNILGNTVSVDYKDERKFAQAAAKVASTAQQVVSLTHRQQYHDNPSDGWEHFRDGTQGGEFSNERHWGMDEWTSRSTQGAYYNWVVGNALVPEEDTVHTGIQKIDRIEVKELQSLPIAAEYLQVTLDNASGHLNPLGLSSGAIAFDISPTELQAGNSHYEQVYDRALNAVLNAKGSFDQAGRMTRLLRNQENQIDNFNTAIEDEEFAYTYKLIDLYGAPYPGDVGPGKTYAQDYDGADLYNWFVVDRPSDLVNTTDPVTITARVPVNVKPFVGFSTMAINTAADQQTAEKTIAVQPNEFVQFADKWRPGVDLGRRSITGRIQQALQAVQLAKLELLAGKDRVEYSYNKFDRKQALLTEVLKYHKEVESALDVSHAKQKRLENLRARSETSANIEEALGKLAKSVGDAASAAPPSVVGVASDGTSALRSSIKFKAAIVERVAQAAAIYLKSQAYAYEVQKEASGFKLVQDLSEKEFSLEEKQLAYEYELLFQEMISQYFEVGALALKLQQAAEEVRTVRALGERIQSDRELFRKRAATVVQGYRTKDLTFRVFRNEALEQYRTLFDLASRYTYLAAKSYDYETGLLGSTQGQAVFRDIVAARALGDVTNGVPQATVSTLGDAGLAGTMAQLQADFSVAEGRLGINNPDQNGTLFSLRSELFRIMDDPLKTEDDTAWRQTLEQHMVSNLMDDSDVATYCRNLRKADGSAVPGIVISFGTTIEHGKNFFGLPLAAADHAFSASNFATKIYSAGVVLDGYNGMDPYAEFIPGAGEPNTNDPNGLSATPYLYLIPTGVDKMLAPPLGDTGVVRSWIVDDQALPLPYNLGSNAFSTTQFFNANDTLSEQPWILRKHQAFRPVDDPVFFYSGLREEFSSSRLIGRSVWNTSWKLVIPAYGLLNDEQEALTRFAATVDDIKLFLRTYSHSGN